MTITTLRKLRRLPWFKAIIVITVAVFILFAAELHHVRA